MYFSTVRTNRFLASRNSSIVDQSDDRGDGGDCPRSSAVNRDRAVVDVEKCIPERPDCSNILFRIHDSQASILTSWRLYREMPATTRKETQF